MVALTMLKVNRQKKIVQQVKLKPKTLVYYDMVMNINNVLNRLKYKHTKLENEIRVIQNQVLKIYSLSSSLSKYLKRQLSNNTVIMTDTHLLVTFIYQH